MCYFSEDTHPYASNEPSTTAAIPIKPNMSINVILGSNLKNGGSAPRPLLIFDFLYIFLFFQKKTHPYASNEPSITAIIPI